MKKIITGVLLLGPVIPTVAFAQALTQVNTIVTSFGTIVNALLPVLLGLAVVVFFWGLIKYIANASDEAAKESGKSLMIWGMIALFVMVALWSILGFVQTQLGITGTVVNSTPPTFIVPTAR